jgi:hypothetical protein
LGLNRFFIKSNEGHKSSLSTSCTRSLTKSLRYDLKVKLDLMNLSFR